MHIPQRGGDAAIREQRGDLMQGFWRKAPVVPLHGVVAHPGLRVALLRMDEIRKLEGIADKEHRRVVAHHVPVALLGVELEREAAWIAGGVGADEFTTRSRSARTSCSYCRPWKTAWRRCISKLLPYE